MLLAYYIKQKGVFKMKRNDDLASTRNEILTNKLGDFHISYKMQNGIEILTATNSMYFVEIELLGKFLSVKVNGSLCNYSLPDSLNMDALATKPISYFVESAKISRGIHRFNELDVREYIYEYLEGKPEFDSDNFSDKKTFVSYFLKEIFDRDFGTANDFTSSGKIYELNKRLHALNSDANLVLFILRLPRRASIFEYSLTSALSTYSTKIAKTV